MILRADARHIPLDDGCVQTCVTSPPYWGLRDYQVKGQIGLEPTPEAYVATMVAVFREIKRVLRDDGTLWLNLGDSFSGSGRGPATSEKQASNGAACIGESARANAVTKWAGEQRIADGLKPKDLIGIPWRVAVARGLCAASGRLVLAQRYYLGEAESDAGERHGPPDAES